MGTEGSTVLEPLWQGLPTLDAASVSGSASCALPPRYEAVKSARDFTRRTLERWDLRKEFDDVALVVSELVTNAMRHGLALTSCLPDPSGAPETGCTDPGRRDSGRTDTAPPEDGTDPPVRLHLMRWSARLVCAVRDPSAEPPEAGTAAGTAVDEDCPSFAAESGRGLRLVDSFSDNWGWHPLPRPHRGKVVWAAFRLGHG